MSREIWERFVHSLSRESTADSRPRPILVVIGTRPEAIKLAPVIRALRERSGFAPIAVSTGQHRELLDRTLLDLEIDIDIDLRLMEHRQNLGPLLASVVGGISELIVRVNPSCLIVQGDTTSAFGAALAAFYAGVPVAHVEAGLRSGVRDDPFPEEANRRMVSAMATWNFAPTSAAAENLRAEGVPADSISVTGNTGIDNLRWVRDRGVGRSVFRENERRVLVTLHRRENQASVMYRLAPHLGELADDGCEVVLPIHPSPKVRDALLPSLSGTRVRVIEPLNYPDFVQTLGAADVVITDSGGVQEEAPYLETHVLVVRNTTERPEGLLAGVATLIGTSGNAMKRECQRVLESRAESAFSSQPCSPYGDGWAADRIVTTLAELAGDPDRTQEVGAA